MTDVSATQEFIKSNAGYYQARLSQAMHNLMTGYPEAGMYLQYLISEAYNGGQDIEISDLCLRQRFVDHSLIDSSSRSLRYQHAQTLWQCFQMDDGVRQKIFSTHHPQNNSESVSVSSDEGETLQESRAYSIGFDLRPR